MSIFSQNDDLFADFKPSETSAQEDSLFFNSSTLKDTDLFSNEVSESNVKSRGETWKTLIVDDEEDIHTITALVLGNYQYKNKPLELLNAYSAEQAKAILQQHDNIALVFLDVVMETHDAGLELVRYVREQLKNSQVRIVLRTGQPGYAPEEKVIIEYEINDYANKTELSRQKLITVTTASLRAYADIMSLEALRQGLEQKVQERTAALRLKNQELNLLNEHLVLLNQEKNEFLGITVHDLKNPLVGILGLSDEIACSFEDYSQEELIEFAKMIQSSAEQMLGLITNLLDVNQIESGNLKTQLSAVNLLDILQDLLKYYTEPALAKNIVLVLQTEPVDYSAYTDRNMIRQIFDNLISNAIKYSPFDKKVYVNIFKNSTQIHCEIRDEGRGILPEEQAKLFGKFTRLSNRPTAGEHSTGLGLFIVKKLLQALQGNVFYRHEEGQGAIFVVTLPAINSLS
ncbi:MAG: hybrid sensor histidine kinase/response regulator [Thiotrichaceae bacterium]|nr:hybrid sensor histidine kinase/response regulator [Thiotrichaceae bacterium]